MSPLDKLMSELIEMIKKTMIPCSMSYDGNNVYIEHPILDKNFAEFVRKIASKFSVEARIINGYLILRGRVEDLYKLYKIIIIYKI